jgi:hypothetical protein
LTRQPSDHLGDPRQGRQVGVEPCATAPASRARSTRRQSASESREGCPSGPDRASPARPPCRRRACQRLAVWREPEGGWRPWAGQAPGTGGLADGAAGRRRKERDADGFDEHASPGPLPHNTRSQRMPHHSTSSVTFPKTWSAGLPQLMRSEPGRTPGFACSAGRILSSGCTLTREQGPPRASRG